MNAAALFAGGIAAGLAAGTASCTAVQGGLLIGLVRPARCCGPPKAGDLAVVGAFVGGRVLSHTAAGALLGLAGAAVRVGPQIRALLLVAAGIAVLALAVRLLRGRAAATATQAACAGAAGHRLDAPPGRARAFALGAATVLVPCGVTISIEVVAVSTGSALGGAAVLAGLALGTAPAFAAAGLLLRRLAATRLAVPAGIIALVAGLFTLGSGLRLGGWLPTFGTPTAGADGRATGEQARLDADGVQRIAIWATDRGFRPGLFQALADRPTEIVFRTRDNRGCTRTLAVDGRDVVLPVTGEQAVRLAPRPPGRLRYACGMGMYVGFVDFVPSGSRTTPASPGRG